MTLFPSLDVSNYALFFVRGFLSQSFRVPVCVSGSAI